MREKATKPDTESLAALHRHASKYHRYKRDFKTNCIDERGLFYSAYRCMRVFQKAYPIEDSDSSSSYSAAAKALNARSKTSTP